MPIDKLKAKAFPKVLYAEIDEQGAVYDEHDVDVVSYDPDFSLVVDPSPEGFLDGETVAKYVLESVGVVKAPKAPKPVYEPIESR